MRTAEEFWYKVDWEGGIEGALKYGMRLDEYDLPDELKLLWCQAEDVINSIRQYEPVEW